MYYFLDIDGVLNRKSDWKRPFTLNPDCVKNFMSLIECDSEPHVILSSTWRQGGDNAHDAFMEYGIPIDGTTPVSNKSRQEEIEYYIRRNGIQKYIVIDDDAGLFPRAAEINLFLTNYKTGLSESDVKKLVRMRKILLKKL